MFPHAVSRTALLTAAARGAESKRPTPLFVDPYAETLAREEGAELLRQHPAPGWFGAALAIRTRVFDDVIVSSVGRGVTQVVLPAAGLDTRAWRLDLPPDVRWFEIDHSPVLDYKAQLLAGAAPRVQRAAVTFDLREENLAQALRQAGFDPSLESVVVVEGLLMYLARDEVGALLASLAVLVPSGRLCADIPNVPSVDPAGSRRGFLDWIAGLGAPWCFGSDDPRGLLARAGWYVDDIVFAGHPRAWPERLPEPLPWPVSDHPPPQAPVTWLVTASRTDPRAGRVVP